MSFLFTLSVTLSRATSPKVRGFLAVILLTPGENLLDRLLYASHPYGELYIVLTSKARPYDINKISPVRHDTILFVGEDSILPLEKASGYIREGQPLPYKHGHPLELREAGSLPYDINTHFVYQQCRDGLWSSVNKPLTMS